MNQIIYKAEASVEGLPEQILSNRSVSYCSQLQPWIPDEVESSKKEDLYKSISMSHENAGVAKGSILDSDLFFTKSILVTTNWNKNDDIFSPTQVWSARHTPSHKPTNIEHDENRLVGHITETWAIDKNGLLIPDNTVAEDLPDFYHIANGAVIYTNWQNDELIDRTMKLVAQIQEGEKFVSMEAIFTNFDYGVVTAEDSFHVVARSEDTAFLTKHLRCYGGDGKFDGCKVGRILKNITFSGKGYVDKPANPHSIIFQDGNVFNHTAASTENPFKRESGVSYSRSSISSNRKLEKSSMSDTQSVDLLKSQNDEFKTTIAGLQAKVEELTKASSEAGIKSLESEVENLGAKLVAAEKERDEALANVETLTSEKNEISDQLTVAMKAKDAMMKEAEDAKKAKVKADRTSTLVEAGVEKDVAEAKVELYDNLTDEQFASIAEDIVAAKMHKEDKEDDKKKEEAMYDKNKASSDDESEDSAEANADESVLENAEATEEPTLTTEASDVSEKTEFQLQVEDLQAAIASRFGYSSDEEDVE